MIAFATVTADPLDVPAHLDAVAAADAGATALFAGTVRDNDPDASGTVVSLEYSAHPDAERILSELAAEADAPGLRIAISHRTGALTVGETAIACAVSSTHRADAFDTCRALVEQVKARLPVWKKQVEADGSHTWVGLGSLAS